MFAKAKAKLAAEVEALEKKKAALVKETAVATPPPRLPRPSPPSSAGRSQPGSPVSVRSGRSSAITTTEEEEDPAPASVPCAFLPDDLRRQRRERLLWTA